MKNKEFYSQYTAEQIEKTLVRSNEKPFVIYQDVDNECYRFFVDQDKANAWIDEYHAALDEGRLMDETIKNYEFPGTYIPGSPNYSAEFLNVEGDGVSNIEGSTNNIIRFRPIIYNRAKENTEEMIEYYVNISNSGNSKPPIYDFARSGELVELNISDYISLGDNDIAINIKGRSSGAQKMINMRYNVFRLHVESNFNISKILDPNKNFSINYSIQGTGQKEVYFYIDGTIAANHTINANDPNATLTQVIVNNDGRYAPGKHTLQIYAVTNGYPSDLLYYEFVISGIPQVFTTCLVAYRFPSGTDPFSGNVPGFKGVQYVALKLDWAYYSNDPTVRNPKVTWRLYDSSGVETHLATRTADIVDAEIDKMPDPVEFMPTGYGQYMLLALIDGYDYTTPNAHIQSIHGHDDPKGLIACYSIWVDQNTQVQEAVDGLELKYSGLGRSNDEPESTRLDLSYNGIAAQFFNFPWNNRIGYIDTAIVTEGNAYWRIPLNPFNQEHDVLGNGNTTEIDFETDGIRDENKPLFLIGDINGLHLAIYATRAELKTAAGVGPTIRFRGLERHRLSFVTYPDTSLAGDQRRFVMLYIDGVRSAAVQYPNTENMVMSGEHTVIGNAEGIATFKLYNLRMYRGILQAYNVLNNYTIDSGSNIATLVKRNDIYMEGSHEQLNIDKLKSIAPVWLLTGPFYRILLPSLDKTEFTGLAIYMDTEHPDLYLEGAELAFKASGESSLSDRMAKGIHVKFNKGSNKIYNNEGKQWNGNRWTPFKGNAPERKIRLNADGLESSHVHNMLLLNTINTVFPKVSINGEYVLRTPAQEYVLNQYPKDMAEKYGGSASDYEFPYKVNFASDWKPVIVVWRPDESSLYSLLGIYSMGEEKKADFAHGRRSIYLKKLDDGRLDPYDMYTGTKGDRGFDNEGIMQFEMVRDSELTLMTGTSSWDTQHEKDIEKVYQDDDDDADAAETAMQWQTYKDEVIKPFADLYSHCEKVDGIPYMKGDQKGYHDLLFSGKFNIWSFLAARIIIRRCGLTDTYVRNSQWVRFPKQYIGKNRDFEWWFAYWDLDMAWGLQQPSGALIIPPGSDREDKVGDNFIFTGKRIEKPEGSWFWDGFDEEIRLGKQRIADAAGLSDVVMNEARHENLYYMMQQMENGLANAGFTVDQLLKDADAIIDKYGEALYNADGQSKYIDSFGAGSDYLLRLQGSRKSHLHWWAHESFERWDSEMVTSNYQANAVSLRVTQNDPTAQIKIKAGGHSFFGWGLTTTVFESGVEHNTGDEFAFTIGRSLNGNDPVQIYSPNKIEELDCSSFADRIGGNIELAALVNKNTGTTIRKINIGVPKGSSLFNTFDGKTWTGIDALSTVEEFNIQGYRYVSQTGTLEFNGNTLNKTKGMTSLSRFYAAGATGLTSMLPAAGVHISDYQLPTTIQSLVLVDSVIDTNGVTWWNDWTQTTLPTTLKTLQMSGMGDNVGAHLLFTEYLTMLSNLSAEDRLQYKLSYTLVNITNVPIELILTLALMKINLSSSINVTGYIHCDTEYTPAQMQVLRNAFGEDCFNNTNPLWFSCDSDRLIISATGTDTTVYTENDKTVIEVKQGSEAILSAVGFGAANSNTTNRWSVVVGVGDFNTGIPEAPMIQIDAEGNFLLHYASGHLIAKECTEPLREYNLYVESTSGATGNAILRIVRRTYPTTASVNFLRSAQSVDYIDGVLQLTSTGSYIFQADHTPNDYDGTMKDIDGGIWSLSGDETLANRIPMEYMNGHSEFDLYCLLVKKLPAEEQTFVLNYESNWKGGKIIEASPFSFIIVGIVEGVLTPSAVTGNPQLYLAIAYTGISHAPNSFSNVDLKQITGDLNITKLIDEAGGNIDQLYDIRSGQGKMYNIVDLLKNITGLTINNAQNLNDTINTTKLKRCKTINLEGTFADFACGDFENNYRL